MECYAPNDYIIIIIITCCLWCVCLYTSEEHIHIRLIKECGNIKDVRATHLNGLPEDAHET